MSLVIKFFKIINFISKINFLVIHMITDFIIMKFNEFPNNYMN